MELIASLILLSVFVIPPMALAGMEVIDRLFSNGAQGNLSKGQSILETNQEESSLYDGMITVEIPVMEPQDVAYEPVLPPGDDNGIELVDPPRRLSNA